MRICRLARQYPRASQPGALLGAYVLSEQLAYPCLYIAKVLDGPPIVTFSAHVTPLLVSYPEPAFPAGYDVSRWRVALVALGKLLGNVVLAARTLPQIARFRPDLFHVHSPLPILPALIYKLLAGTPIVLTFHGTDYYRFERSRLTRFLIRRFVDHVICLSPDQPDRFRQLVPGHAADYIANGVDLRLFSPDATVPRRKQVVAVGRLTWQKGYDDLLRAMAEVLTSLPDYRLVIVGDGELKPRLSALAQELGLGDRVDFAGMVDQPTLVGILRSSELFVMSSVSEGFPKALIEAMACGLPVVVTDTGACAAVASNCGVVVAPGRPEALAEAILSILGDPEHREACGQRARVDAGRYGWERHVEEVRIIYERVLRDRPRGALSSTAQPASGRPRQPASDRARP
jgi:glycosyltransferase involved in cell wall biosynthesis